KLGREFVVRILFQEFPAFLVRLLPELFSRHAFFLGCSPRSPRFSGDGSRHSGLMLFRSTFSSNAAGGGVHRRLFRCTLGRGRSLLQCRSKFLKSFVEVLYSELDISIFDLVGDRKAILLASVKLRVLVLPCGSFLPGTDSICAIP